MIYWYLCLLLPVITATGHMAMKGRPFKRGQLIEIWLIHIVFWGIGIAGIFGFITSSCGSLGDWLAKDLGWEKGSPFQMVLGFGFLALGVMGVLGAFLRGGFLVAAIFAGVTYGIGEAFVTLFNGVPVRYLVLAIIYDWGGSALVLALMFVYRTRVNRKTFWTCCVPERVARCFPK